MPAWASCCWSWGRAFSTVWRTAAWGDTKTAVAVLSLMLIEMRNGPSSGGSRRSSAVCGMLFAPWEMDTNWRLKSALQLGLPSGVDTENMEPGVQAGDATGRVDGESNSLNSSPEVEYS